MLAESFFKIRAKLSAAHIRHLLSSRRMTVEIY